MKFNSETKAQLINWAKTKNIFLEGNILKVIELDEDEEFTKYIRFAIDKDTETRKKRLEMTKQIQKQNNELIKWKSENEKINSELKIALDSSQKSKEIVLNDLELLQKKTQYQLIETIVKVSLWVICGIGIVTTLLFTMTILMGIENKIIESIWSNMFGILLTNSFSIIGTIMGVKYASEKNKGSRCNCNCEGDK
jgi:hypothetical protein